MNNNISTMPFDVLRDWIVVVIDDEEDSLEVARYMLDFYGAQVHTAENGREGLELVKRVRPRFVISDLSMPVMDGWELIHHLQNDPATVAIPVIALTAHAMQGDRERALGAGFQNYLTKPLTVDRFIHDLIALLIDIPMFTEELEARRNA